MNTEITGATLKVGSIVELETLKVDQVFGGRKNALKPR